MKKITTLFLSLILLISCKDEMSCKEDNINTIPVGIDVQSFFEQDKVQITIDSKEIMNKKLLTHSSLGVCPEGQIQIKLNEGNHVMKVTVNNSTTKTETFLLEKDLYIGVNYAKETKEISFVYFDQPFMYD
jgi:hypothetical protein